MNYKKFDEIRNLVLGYAFKYFKNTHDAEEAAHNAIIKLIPKIDRINKTYIFKTVYSVCMDMKNEQKRYVEYNDNIKQHEEKKGLWDLSESEIKELLNEDDFKVYKTYIENDLDKNKMAQTTGKSFNTVDKIVSRMRRNLRANLLLSNRWKWGKDILTYQQFENIKNLLKVIKKRVETKDLRYGKNYFKKCKDEFPKLDLKSSLDFDIAKRKKGLPGYRLTVLSKDLNDNPFIWGMMMNFEKNNIFVNKIFIATQMVKSSKIKKQDLCKDEKHEKGLYKFNFEKISQKVNNLENKNS